MSVAGRYEVAQYLVLVLGNIAGKRSILHHLAANFYAKNLAKNKFKICCMSDDRIVQSPRVVNKILTMNSTDVYMIVDMLSHQHFFDSELDEAGCLSIMKMRKPYICCISSI